MSVSRRGFLSSLLGLAAASLSPIGLLFDRRPAITEMADGLCGYWRLDELPKAGGTAMGWFRTDENMIEVHHWDPEAEKSVFDRSLEGWVEPRRPGRP